MSAGAVGSATISDLQNANAIVKVAKAEASLPLTTQPVPFDSILGLSPERLMKLEGLVCGLVVAPRRWYLRVQTDLKAHSRRRRQLDPCLYMRHNAAGQTVGIVGVYVDDFIMSLSTCADVQKWRESVRNMCTWGSWGTYSCKLCGVQYTQKSD